MRECYLIRLGLRKKGKARGRIEQRFVAWDRVRLVLKWDRYRRMGEEILAWEAGGRILGLLALALLLGKKEQGRMIGLMLKVRTIVAEAMILTLKKQGLLKLLRRIKRRNLNCLEMRRRERRLRVSQWRKQKMLRGLLIGKRRWEAMDLILMMIKMIRGSMINKIKKKRLSLRRNRLRRSVKKNKLLNLNQICLIWKKTHSNLPLLILVRVVTLCFQIYRSLDSNLLFSRMLRIFSRLMSSSSSSCSSSCSSSSSSSSNSNYKIYSLSNSSSSKISLQSSNSKLDLYFLKWIFQVIHNKQAHPINHSFKTCRCSRIFHHNHPLTQVHLQISPTQECSHLSTKHLLLISPLNSSNLQAQ